jgi:hypothetical protein
MSLLDDHHFPEELHVREQTFPNGKSEYVFTYPDKPPSSELISRMRSLQTTTSGVLVLVKSSEHSVHIQGPVAEDRLDSLLFLLEHMLLNDKPLYLSPFPIFGISTWQCLFPNIPSNATRDDLRQLPEVQYDKWSTPIPKINPPFTEFIHNSFEATPALAALLVAYFAPNDLTAFYRIQKEPHVFRLSLPAPLQVCFRLLKTGRYRLSFADIPPHTAGEIRNQIDKAIAVLVTQDCFVITLTKTDPFSVVDLENALEDYPVVRLPTEELRLIEEEEDDFEEPSATMTTKLLLTIRDFGDEDEVEIRRIVEHFFAGVRLVLCSKCKCLYNLQNDVDCFQYFHGGDKIPFDHGEMEVFDTDENNEIVVWVKWSCCGEMKIDDVPVDCKEGKKEKNGVHEQDGNTSQNSQLSFERKKVGEFV